MWGGRKSLQSERHVHHTLYSVPLCMGCLYKGYRKSSSTAFSPETPLPGLWTEDLTIPLNHHLLCLLCTQLCARWCLVYCLCPWIVTMPLVISGGLGCISDWDLNLSFTGKLWKLKYTDPSMPCTIVVQVVSPSLVPQTAWNNLGSNYTDVTGKWALQRSPFQGSYWSCCRTQCQLKSHKKNKYLNTSWWSPCVVHGTKPLPWALSQISTNCQPSVYWI